MDFTATPRGLWEEVTALLAENGVGADTVFGKVGRDMHGSPPRYVWVPTRMRDEKKLVTTRLGDGETRVLFASDHLVEIDCWGVSDHQAWAMACNVINACYQIRRASMKLESGEWVRPKEAHNQRGELFRLEISLDVPVGEGFISLTDLLVPVVETFIPARIETDIYHSPSINEDGEFGIKVIT
jgi:hypothetical protein